MDSPLLTHPYTTVHSLAHHKPYLKHTGAPHKGTLCLSVKANFCVSLLRKDHFVVVVVVVGLHSERCVNDPKPHYLGPGCGKCSVELVELLAWCIDVNSLFFAP